MRQHLKGRTISYHEHKFQYVAGRVNYHHILPQSRGGQKTTRNLLCIDVFKHQAWHYIFGTMTILEASLYLLTVKGFNSHRDYSREAYHLIFGYRTFKETSKFLERLDSLKCHQTNQSYH